LHATTLYTTFELILQRQIRSKKILSVSAPRDVAAGNPAQWANRHGVEPRVPSTFD
jgi:hypothetical protein